MSHRAVVLEAIGSPLVLTERRIPSPQAGQILVKVLVAGINPHDSYCKRFGLFVANSMPTPLANDIVGKVVKLGPGVTHVDVNDIVFGYGDMSMPDQVGTQEYCILEAFETDKVPSNVTLEEAATFPLNPMTSFLAMFSKQGWNMPPPFKGQKTDFDYAVQSVVIVGAGSATGKAALQFAKLVGIGTVVGIASKANEKLLLSYGATHIIHRHQSEAEIEKQVRAVVGDELIYALDCVGMGEGGQTIGARVLSNSKRGTLAALVHAGSVDETKIGEKKAGYERKVITCDTKGQKETSVPFWQHLRGWVEDGTLKAGSFEVIGGLDAETINRAIDGYDTGMTKVKPLLRVAEVGGANVNEDQK